ncbi:MAG: PIG-L family deacetylase [Chitinophagaceae bacterium]|nr:PIG-L family deacetylase [Chitinophagaceae bacterium]
MEKTPAPKQEHKKSKTVAVIVAHPDDETLWAGGTILSHPSWQWFIVCLCRGSDKERAPRFYKALKVLKSEGIMGDLDDGPEQKALDGKEVERAILYLLPMKHFDLIITHNPTGEYTRHIRHEEVSKAVIKLWHAGKLSANELWTFAYEDGNKEYYPRPVENASICRILTKRIWLRKYSIITETYGFEKSSFEAETAPKAEAFWQFTDPYDAKKWLNNRRVLT